MLLGKLRVLWVILSRSRLSCSISISLRPQPIIATLSQQRSNHSNELSTHPSSASRLLPCTLILIDRTIDLFTPSSHDPCPPLAHRILSTIKKSNNPLSDPSVQSQLDISLPQPLFSMLYPQSQHGVLESPLSAVSTLPIQLLPSISPPYNSSLDPEDDESANDIFMNAVCAINEEKGKTTIYEALRKEITEHNGVLPPSKKRGIGAELLVLVGAILSTPFESTGAEHAPSYNIHVAIESAGLLSWCIAIIDSMQRSSTKQLQTHLSTLPDAQYLLQCLSSYEMKSTRERVILTSIIQQYQLSLISHSVLIDMILEVYGLVSISSETSPTNPVDLPHLFQMIVG
jgi:hypothetical protein